MGALGRMAGAAAASKRAGGGHSGGHAGGHSNDWTLGAPLKPYKLQPELNWSSHCFLGEARGQPTAGAPCALPPSMRAEDIDPDVALARHLDRLERDIGGGRATDAKGENV